MTISRGHAQHVGASLARTFEVTARAGDGHALVHHPLADAKVLVEPLGHIFVLASYSVGLETGPRTSHKAGKR